MDDAHRLLREGRFEAAEERARAAVAKREGARGRDRRPMAVRQARYYAIWAAALHGRGASVLPELEDLIADLEPPTDASPLLLRARLTRAWVLIDEARPAEAQSEAEAVLRVLTRTKYVTDVWELELIALVCMADVLCALDRHEEAETIARGHLPRAPEHFAFGLHLSLLHSLSGQGRHQEALDECDVHHPDSSPADFGAHEFATAVALHGLGRHDEAKEQARRALTACERHLHPDHPRVGEIGALLARMAAA
ncbi:tetratricopeptide repeat protein [Streptomyces virginiae]|uniref:hypothetical protein n=1 Tax=Streptomyces virginiae TaxID=1961 RepID=UPI003697BF06